MRALSGEKRNKRIDSLELGMATCCLSRFNVTSAGWSTSHERNTTLRPLVIDCLSLTREELILT